jgi:methionyl-tRNA synthetase
MLKANELGITPEALIKDVSERHQADFKDFFIGFSQYGSAEVTRIFLGVIINIRVN